MRLLMLPLVLVSLLAACSKPAPAPEPVRAVRTLTVQAGSANLLHEYPAEVRARAESRPAFRVGGKLVKRMVNVGDVVKAGQALAEIDPGDLRLGQDAARASLSAAQAQLAFAESEFKRYMTLREQGFISGVELERRDAALKAAWKKQQDALSASGQREVEPAADAIGSEEKMKAAMDMSTPVLREPIKPDDAHLPFVTDEERRSLVLHQAMMVSATHSASRRAARSTWATAGR